VTGDEVSDRTAGMKTKPQNYKDLVVWQKGIALAKIVYGLTQNFPSAEKFGLVSQMRRAAVSIRSNLRRVKPGILRVSLSNSFRTPKA